MGRAHLGEILENQRLKWIAKVAGSRIEGNSSLNRPADLSKNLSLTKY